MSRETIDNIINDLIDTLEARLGAIEVQYLRQAGETLKWIMDKNATPAELMGLLTKQEYQERIARDLQRIAHYQSGATVLAYGDLESTARQIWAELFDQGKEFEKLKGRGLSPADSYKAMITPMVRKVMRDYTIMAKSTAVDTHYKKTIGSFVNRIARGGQEQMNRGEAMRAAVTQLADEGISIIHYQGEGKKPYSRRLDSSVRVAMSGEMYQIADTISDRIGEEVGYDAKEITVESAPAIDHENVQGMIFDLENWELLNNHELAYDIDGGAHLLEHRAIGEYNCRHFGMNFMLGVSERSYTPEELAANNKRNQEGIEFDGQHMSLYQATQWQRKNETEQRRTRAAREVLYPFRNDKEFKADYKELGARVRALDTSYKRMGAALEPMALRMKPERKYNINARAAR